MSRVLDGYSPEFHALITRALDHALELIRDCGGEFTAFVLHRDRDGDHFSVHVTEWREEAPVRCRETVRSFPDSVSAYVIVYDGYVTPSGGAKTDAIIAEAGERGRERGLVLAQAYRLRRFPTREVSLIGQCAIVSYALNYLEEHIH